MGYRKLPDYEDVMTWLDNDPACEGGTLCFPEDHVNAFMGLLRGPYPAPIFDEMVITTNLQRLDMSPSEIRAFLKERSGYRQDGYPLIARRYELT